MRVLHTCALVLALSSASISVLAQAPQSTVADPAAASVDYLALREGLANQNKALTGDVQAQRSIVKRNQDLLKEAQKLDAANKKLIAEKQKLNEENANLEKQRAALAASQSETAAAVAK
jgi:hypothetical protein